MNRNQVFVTYAHADAQFLARLRVHLRPFERRALVDVWADTKIRPGQLWQAEIEKALSRAAVAVVLVSADFLASEFVANNELPPLLAAASSSGVKILPIILKPCAFTDIEELAQFQALNDPAKPLLSVGEAEQEAVWLTVARTVSEEMKRLAPPVTATSGAFGASGFGTPAVTLKAPAVPVHDYYGLCQEELADPAVVADFHVYSYHFFDDLAFFSDPGRLFGEFKTFPELMRKVGKRLRDAGWEGDGKIGLLWLPPFLDAGVEDTYGVCVWHVKQKNNGTSWLASPVPLPFGRLLGQNA